MSAEKPPAWEAEYDTVRDLLGQSFMRLRFPVSFEKDFRHNMNTRALETVRENYWMLFLLALSAVLVIYFQYTVGGVWIGATEDLRLAVLMGLCIISVLVLFTSLAKMTSLDGYFFSYTAVCCILMLLFMTVFPVYFRDEVLRQRSTYLVIYVLMIVYGVAQLRLHQAALIGFFSMGLVLLVINILGVRYDWGMFMQFFFLTNLVGVGNSYVVEVRERRLFLQSRLLELEKRQLNKLSERLVQLAREDGLTGLANRRHFNDRFLMEWERARRDGTPLALVFGDVDHFKAFNDKHGHLEGDRALVAVADVLKSVATRPGDLAARYGGEEFVLLLPNTTCDGAVEVARELIAGIDAKAISHRASKVAKHVTISAGVASMVPDVHIAPATLIDLADEALYAAKHEGRHRVVVSTTC
ncbi:MAG: diguanylate cyclase [Paraperlucidibaca sp.]